jgi:hypothetical protein
MRALPSHTAFPTYVVLHAGSATPLSTAGPTGSSLAQIRHAYGFDQLGTAANGSGTTIAIVDAYNDPKISSSSSSGYASSDLAKFSQAMGLPNFGAGGPTFTKVNETGGTSYPATDRGWSSEIALDVEWAHAIAPEASILLVEANSASFTDLFKAVDYAAAYQGVVAVSMSWGGNDFSGENAYDGNFQTPANHPGVTFLASSGDAGAPVGYPAISPNVISVGGTTTIMDGSGNISSEQGWSGSGGGLSGFESRPSYQNGVQAVVGGARGNPDVAYDADPNTGFPVYDTENNLSSKPWSQFGGTSDASPQWAALIALADQGRALHGLQPLDGPSQTLQMLYASAAAGDFNDIVGGTSTGKPNYTAGPGYDLVTGLGTPKANLLVPYLAGSVPANVPTFSISSVSAVAGTQFNITVTAMLGNQVDTGYTGIIHFTSSDSNAVLPADTTLTAGTGSFAVTLKTAGSQTIAATDTMNSASTGSAAFTVSVAAPATVSFGQQPTAATAGAIIAPAVTAQVLDAYGNPVTGASVTLTLGGTGGGTLGGTITATTSSAGLATFSNLSVSQAGTYTLTPSTGTLTGTTSSSFVISATPPPGTSVLLEGFETAGSWNVVGGALTAVRATYAAHDGSYGLDQANGNDWLYRSDSAAQLSRGDTVSVWLDLAGAANGRAYFAFGASSGGTLSLVVAPNSNQLILQNNSGWGFVNLAQVGQRFRANHWYRLEVDWGTSGTIVGKLFDSNGTSLLNSVAGTTNAITSGGFGFRATGGDKYWDTVTAQYTVNSFAHPSISAPANDVASGAGGMASPTSKPTALTAEELLVLWWVEVGQGHPLAAW